MHTAEPHRRQIICQLPADPRGLTITQQKRYCSRCPHDFQERQAHDARRDNWFVSQGYRVLRFTNDDVLKNLEGVVAVIAGALPPSLSLPHKGGGND